MKVLHNKVKETSYRYKVKNLDEFMDALAEIINEKDPKAFEVGYKKSGRKLPSSGGR